MVTKKNKFTSFFLTILIICIVSLALIITVMDEQSKNKLEAQQKAEQEMYDKLDSLINTVKSSTNSLKNGINSYIKSIEELEKEINKIKANSYDEDEYNAATLVRAEKLLLLSKILVEFEDGTDDLGFDIDELLVYGSGYTAYVEKLYSDAWVQIERAASVAKQDEILDNFKNTLYTMPNRVQKVYNALEELEKDGITLSDETNIHHVIECFNDMPKDKKGNPLYTQADIDALYAPDEKEALLERLDTAIIAYIPLVTEDFIKQVSVLPKYISLESKEIIIKAETTRNALKALCESQSDAVIRAYKNATAISTDYHVTNKSLIKYRSRLDQLLAAKAAADSINETLAKYDKSSMKPNSNTLAELQDFEAAIEEWIKNSKHEIVKNDINNVKGKCTEQLHKGDKAVCEHCGYVAANYNMVNHSAFESLMAQYNKLMSNGLASWAQAVIDSTNKIYSDNDKLYGLEDMITLNDSDAILTAAHSFYKLWYQISVVQSDKDASNNVDLSSTMPKTDKTIATNTISKLNDKNKTSIFEILNDTKYDAAVAEIDYVLGLKEDNKTAGIDTLAGVVAKLRQGKRDYDHIVAEIAKINDYVVNLPLIETVVNGKSVKNYNYAYIVAHQGELVKVDEIIYNLIVDYDIDSYLDVVYDKMDDGKKLTDPEDMLDDLLTKYMEIRLIPLYTEVLSRIENARASFRGTVHQAQADSKAEELNDRAEELLKEKYEFSPKVTINNGLGQYVGEWSDRTNETKYALQAIIYNLGASFTFDNPEVSN